MKTTETELKRYRKVAREIHCIDRMISRRMDAITSANLDGNLSGKEMWIIGYLFHNRGKDIYQRDIEKEFGVARSTVTKMIQELEKRGYVARSGVDHDARLKKLVLTDKALQANEQIRRDMQVQVDERILQGISEEQLELFAAVIGQMRQNLTDGTEEDG